MSLEYATWEALSTYDKTQQLKSWMQELIAVEKSIANPPSQMYTKLKRRTVLRNNIQDVTRFEQADWDYEKSKQKK